MNILNNRASGVLMHISSLPGDTGIGTLGKQAYDFVDFLKKSGQTYWQILPICPTSYGDSPYQSFSTFAGNPYFIDFHLLEEDGYIKEEDYKDVDWGGSISYVDYAKLYVERNKIFKVICENFKKNPAEDYQEFCKEQKSWLDDYALFMAIKDKHDGIAFDLWEEDIRLRDADALKKWKKECKKEIEQYKILQYLFYHQWFLLKNYANENGIYIIGDIPIYVAADSADVWTNPQNFVLDEERKPIEVAGCPPDAFSEDGQLWGNPIYDWPAMKKTKYKWWKNRLGAGLKIYDVIRIDHFRGFDSFYAIPYGEKTAKHGVWREGPGLDLFTELKKEFGEMNIIAEDLGFLTDSVVKLLKDSGYPGMKVLQFAFGNGSESDYLPFRYEKNSVVYTGTHDNDTNIGWLSTLAEKDLAFAKEFLRLDDEKKIPEELLITALGSVCNTCILTIQDLIGLGSEARINTPSTVGNNWKWRATKEQLSDDICQWLLKYTKLYNR